MDRMGSIRKSIKQPSFKKKILSWYFCLKKNVFFFFKAYNFQIKRSFFFRKIMILQDINSYNLYKFKPILLVGF